MNKFGLIVLICGLFIIGVCWIFFNNNSIQNEEFKDNLVEGKGKLENLVENEKLEKFKETPAENEEQAIKIAKEYVLKEYGKSFDDYQIEVRTESELDAGGRDDVWIVWYSYIDENGESGYAGGGGPAVYIEKATGKVITCFLQK